MPTYFFFKTRSVILLLHRTEVSAAFETGQNVVVFYFYYEYNMDTFKGIYFKINNLSYLVVEILSIYKFAV